MRLDDRVLPDAAPLRLVGPGTITVDAAGYEALTLRLPGGAGTSSSLAITGSPEGPVPRDAQRVVLRLRVVGPTAVPTPTHDEVSAPVMVSNAGVAPRRALRPWVIAASATAGAFVLAGIGFSVWRQERSAAYLSLGCGATSVDALCLSTYDQFDTAKSLQVASFVTAGVFVGGAVALWLLDRRDAGRARRRADGISGCVAIVGAVRCAR